MKNNFRLALLLLFINAAACRPVIAIGWEEFFLLFILIAFLLGPPLYRFLRRIEDFRKYTQKKK